MSALRAVLGRLFDPQYMIRSTEKLGNDYPAVPMYKTFIALAWPALMESFFGGLITFIDTVMVSGEGEIAVAAVGLTNQPRLLFYALFLSLSVAVNAIVARRFGEKRPDSANKCLAMALPITVVLSVLCTAIAFLISRPLLLFAGAQEDTIDIAVDYFRIVMIGLNFQVFSLMINAAQRGCGNTRISMTSNVSANIVNVTLNALLINGLFFFPHLGVIGAAIATMMGNMTSAVVSLFSILKKDRFLRLQPKEMFRWDMPMLRTMMNVGSGSLVEQVFMRIGFFTYAKLVAELGTMEFATHQICMSIITLSFTVGDGLGVASASLVGQNLGRGRPDHSLIYGKIGQRIGIGISVLLVLLFTFGAPFLVDLFTDDETIIQVGVRLLYIVAVTAPFQISQVIFRGCLNGAGDTKFMAVVSFISIAVVRPVMAYVLCYPVGWGVYGAWIALFLDQFTRFLFASIRFSGSGWYKKKL